MNLLESTVLAVLESPKERSNGDWWSLKVKTVCWGREEENILYFDTKEEAEAVAPGYIHVG